MTFQGWGCHKFLGNVFKDLNEQFTVKYQLDIPQKLKIAMSKIEILKISRKLGHFRLEKRKERVQSSL